MPAIEKLNPTNHKDIRIITTRSAHYGDQVMVCQTFAGEFRSAQNQYPLLFQSINEEIMPVALFGLERGENLFLENERWNARYIPLMVQRQPFSIGLENVEADEPRKVINIDMSSSRISQTEGRRLFDDLGEPTDFLSRMSAMLDTIDKWNSFNMGFMEALSEHDLLEPVSFDIGLSSGDKGQLIGFLGINEDKFRDLSDASVTALWQSGYLDAIYMVLASVSNIGALAELKSKRYSMQREYSE